MRFVCFLLSLVTALTAVVTFMVALFSNFTDDPHNPVTPWARALFGDAGALVVLGLLAAIPPRRRCSGAPPCWASPAW
jgi:hypothetical protein